jgi:protein-tyrosine-phosphatase
MSNGNLRVLFLCTGNAARSQMAEALLRHLSRGRANVSSAGSSPEASVHPLAKQTLEQKFNIDASMLRPKSLNQYLNEPFDYVITVCDKVAESCPLFPGASQRIHWSFEDPAAVVDPENRRRAFENVANGLAARLRIWISLPEVRKRLDGERTDDRTEGPARPLEAGSSTVR